MLRASKRRSPDVVTDPVPSAKEARRRYVSDAKNVVEAIKAVAQRLGNTPAVCRKCYVRPAVLEFHLSGKLQRNTRRKLEAAADEIVRETHEETLRKEEGAVMNLLQQYLETRRQ